MLLLGYSFRRGLAGLLLLGLLGLLGLLSGCSTTPDRPDPYEKFNRYVFQFNDDIDKILLKPVAETYKTLVPQPIGKGITNIFGNLSDITVIANDLLQLKFKQATSDTGRLIINSTLGIFGFFDMATYTGLPKHYEDFGQTLGHWGLGNGPYLVLPFFGPSTVRDAWGRGGDIFLDPRFYYASAQDSNVRNFITFTNVLRAIDIRANLLKVEEFVDTAALDTYSYVRDAYLQQRNYMLYDGNPPPESMGGAFSEDELFDDVTSNPP